MADLGTTTAPAPTDPGPGDDIGRRVTRRRTLPGGRAVVGALLITLAVIGVFAAWLSATSAPTTSYVVVRTDLAPGEELAPDDLRLVAMDLPEEQAARTFTSIEDATASVTLSPLAVGDLLTRSVVRPPDDVPGTALFSFEVASARAVAGELRPGDRVDVLATDDGVTGYVATDVPVVRAGGDGGDLVVTVALDDPALVLALAHASDEGSLHVSLANPQQPADADVRRDSFAGADEVSDDATPPPDEPDATPTPPPAPSPAPGGDG